MALIELTPCPGASIVRAGEAVVKIELFITGNIINSPGESFPRELGGKAEVTVAVEARCSLGYARRKGLLPARWRESCVPEISTQGTLESSRGHRGPGPPWSGVDRMAQMQHSPPL